LSQIINILILRIQCILPDLSYTRIDILAYFEKKNNLKFTGDIFYFFYYLKSYWNWNWNFDFKENLFLLKVVQLGNTNPILFKNIDISNNRLFLKMAYYFMIVLPIYNKEHFSNAPLQELPFCLKFMFQF